MEYLLLFLLLIIIVLQLTSLKKRKSNDFIQLENKIKEIESSIGKFEIHLKDDFRISREESSKNSKENRDELSKSIKEFSFDQKIKFDELKSEQKELTSKTVEQLEKVTTKIEDKLKTLTEKAENDSTLMRETLIKRFGEFQENFDKNIVSINDIQREKFKQMDENQLKLIENTEKKLEQMRETVDEKLQKTLNERLGQSFESVGKQLEAVQLGLGEMKTLANDVGGLKKVLSNVKQRGGVGEIQLEMLLEQLLAPDQFEANVKTKPNSIEVVEFAIKLPGRDDKQNCVYLPIDAKFPKDAYEQMVDAYDLGDVAQIEIANKNIEAVIKKMAKDMFEKYINPPTTTDFAIMFLPFEGMYAEVVRRSHLLEHLQREFKVIVAGPTTFAAILNSLQMGFRTLALQKRSSEVWSILGAVKKEFENFGGMLEKAQKNIHTGLGQLDNVMGVRTRAIIKNLKNVEALGEFETKQLLPEIGSGEITDDDEISQ